MSGIIVSVEDITKNYGNGKGVFDLNFQVTSGEIFGLVGTNGSGKTTTIRQIMGFVKPTSGKISVLGKDSWLDSASIKNHVSYVPGEIAFPDIGKGAEFLKMHADFLGVKDMRYADYLTGVLKLDTSADIKRMSKGMKQKTAIIAALMGEKEILILDEPTTGLDPLMREIFIDIVKQEKQKGRTVLMSSHIFEEIENTCDRVALIKDGRIAEIANVNDIKRHNTKEFRVGFKAKADINSFAELYSGKIIGAKNSEITVLVNDSEAGEFFGALKNYAILYITEVKNTLEKHFREIYSRKEKENE